MSRPISASRYCIYIQYQGCPTGIETAQMSGYSTGSLMRSIKWGPSFLTLPTALSTGYQSNASTGMECSKAISSAS